MLEQYIGHDVRQLCKLFTETFVDRTIVRLQHFILHAEALQLLLSLLKFTCRPFLNSENK